MVRLPEIELDDRGFQELVSEARTRIARRCPEWTEHNVSDPGITLIELFAWMTEMTTYRLNRVPDKIYVRLLELLGVPMRPRDAGAHARALHARGPAERADHDRGRRDRGRDGAHGLRGVRRLRGRREPHDRAAAPVGLRRRPRRRAAQHRRRRRRRAPDRRRPRRVLGRARSPATRCTSASTSRCRGCSCASRSRPSPRAAPASTRAARRCAGRCRAGEQPGGDLVWEPVTVLEDTTGGFNFGSGEVLLELAGDSERVPFGGHRLHWLRCRVATPEEAGGAALRAPARGLHDHRRADRRDPHVPARRARRQRGPRRERRHAGPVVPRPAPADARAVRGRVARGARPADRRRGSAGARASPSTSADPTTASTSATPRNGHDRARPRGAPGRRRLALLRRGAAEGRDAAACRATAPAAACAATSLPGTLTVLKAGPPGIASVTNPAGARGGVDPEQLDSVRVRGAMELRARHRAVTAEDFEHLAREASPRVARAVCVPPDEGNAVAVRILPRLHPADRRLEFDELQPPRELLDEVANAPRRAPPARRDAARRAGAPARRERRRRAADRAARRPRAHPRADAARALPLPQPARRRHAGRRWARAGSSAAR